MTSKFFCDIRGTYNYGIDRERALCDFVDYLNNLYNSDKIIFSFVSSDSVDFVKECMIELSHYLGGSKIVFGNQYAGDKVINDNNVNEIEPIKAIQIYTDLLNIPCQTVYYAEDHMINRKTLKN